MNTATPFNSSYATDKSQTKAKLLSTATIAGGDVRNMRRKKLGKIQDLVLDISDGKILYAVFSSGGFFGIGGSLFAVPWQALTLDAENSCFLMDVDGDCLKDAPDFDENELPNWLTQPGIHSSPPVSAAREKQYA